MRSQPVYGQRRKTHLSQRHAKFFELKRHLSHTVMAVPRSKTILVKTDTATCMIISGGAFCHNTVLTSVPPT